MLVFWKERMVYLSVPKTGSSAIHSVLGRHAAVAMRSPPRLKHTNITRFTRQFRPLLFENTKNIETIAVMRDPLQWLGSWYRYRGRDGLIGHAKSTKDVSFDEFVNGYLSPNQPAFAALGSQNKFLCGNELASPVDHIFDHADMGQFVSFMSERLEKSLELPNKNVSPQGELDLDAATLQRLYRALDADFSLYDDVKRQAEIRRSSAF